MPTRSLSTRTKFTPGHCSRHDVEGQVDLSGWLYLLSHQRFFQRQSSQGDLSSISNPYDGWKYDYGPSALDIRTISFTNFVYKVPMFKNSAQPLVKTLFSGWEISGIITAASGAALNIGLNGQNVASIVPNTVNRPNVSGRMVNPHTVQEWFDTPVLSSPAPGTWGDEPPNAVSNPGREKLEHFFLQEFPVRRRTRQQSPVPGRVLQPLEPPAMGRGHAQRRHQHQLRQPTISAQFCRKFPQADVEPDPFPTSGLSR